MLPPHTMHDSKQYDLWDFTDVSIHTHTHTCAPPHTHTHTCAPPHTYTHTHTHTHTHMNSVTHAYTHVYCILKINSILHLNRDKYAQMLN